MLAEPIKDELVKYNSRKDNEEVREHLLTDFLSSIPNRFTVFFGAGWSKNVLVRITGLEPARLLTIEPKSIASANSAISAYF